MYSRYFHSDLPPGSRTACFWGSCFYPIGDYWVYGEYRRITLTLTSASGPVDNMSMYSWTGTLPAVTPVTAENFLSLGANPPVGQSASATFPPGSDGFSIEVKASDAAYPLDVRVDYDLVSGDPPYCQYGTRQNMGVQPIIFITAALVDAAIFAAGGGVLMATAFDTMIGLPVLLANTCDVTPPAFPLFGPADFIPGTQIWSPASFDKRLSWLKTAIWTLYCECVPAPIGSPAPKPMPQAKVEPTGPAGVQTTAPIICDGGDVCSALNILSRQTIDGRHRNDMPQHAADDDERQQ